MKLVVLATATDESAKEESEETQRFNALKSRLGGHNVRIEASWALLGKYDYLLVLDAPDDVQNAFAALSEIAQSGSMRTETFMAIPLESYFEIAARIAGG